MVLLPNLWSMSSSISPITQILSPRTMCRPSTTYDMSIKSWPRSPCPQGHLALCAGPAQPTICPLSLGQDHRVHRVTSHYVQAQHKLRYVLKVLAKITVSTGSPRTMSRPSTTYDMSLKPLPKSPCPQGWHALCAGPAQPTICPLSRGQNRRDHRVGTHYVQPSTTYDMSLKPWPKSPCPQGWHALCAGPAQPTICPLSRGQNHRAHRLGTHYVQAKHNLHNVH